MGVSKVIGSDVPNLMKDVPNFVKDVSRLCFLLVHIAYQYNGFSNRHASKIKGVALVCILHIVYQNNVIIPWYKFCYYNYIIM